MGWDHEQESGTDVVAGPVRCDGLHTAFRPVSTGQVGEKTDGGLVTIFPLHNLLHPDSPMFFGTQIDVSITLKGAAAGLMTQEDSE